MRKKYKKLVYLIILLLFLKIAFTTTPAHGSSNGSSNDSSNGNGNNSNGSSNSSRNSNGSNGAMVAIERANKGFVWMCFSLSSVVRKIPRRPLLFPPTWTWKAADWQPRVVLRRFYNNAANLSLNVLTPLRDVDRFLSIGRVLKRFARYLVIGGWL